MGKPYTYLFDHSKPYYNRAEKRLRNADGTQAPQMLITRYTTGYKWQTNGVQGPRGGKARKQRKYNVYYLGGIFYRSKRVRTEDGKSLNTYEVFDGVIFDTYETSSRKQGVPVVHIELVEGVPVEVTDLDGNTVWEFGASIAELEEMLKIPEAYRAEQPTEEPERTELETALQDLEDTCAAIIAKSEREAMDAARNVWMESTTATGDQLDLIAYFGYGDASWQDLAAPAA